MIVESSILIVAFSAAIFFALTLGGLAILRRQKTISARAFLFLVFCYGCVWVTLLIARNSQLTIGEAATAWMVALIIVGTVLAIKAYRNPARTIIRYPGLTGFRQRPPISTP